MQINISGHHLEVSPAIRDYVTGKFDRIRRHFDHITNVNVILSVERKIQHKAEARINVPGSDIYADCEEKDMYAAMDGLIDKLDRQVREYKNKLSEHGGNGKSE
jgi:ribosome hibernation promoting factor